MHQLPAFANMTMSVRRELCAVMVFAVVERAGTIVLNDGEEVGTYFYHLQIFFWGSLNKAEEQKPHSSFLFKNSGQQWVWIIQKLWYTLCCVRIFQIH